MERLEVDGMAEDQQPSNLSLTGPENRQFDANGMEQDLHANMSHENRDIISHG